MQSSPPRVAPSVTSRPERDDRRTVAVPRGVLITGVALLVVCLLVIAFLLGRQSADRRDTARWTPPAGQAAPPPGVVTPWPVVPGVEPAPAPGVPNPNAPAAAEAPAAAGS